MIRSGGESMSPPEDPQAMPHPASMSGVFEYRCTIDEIPDGPRKRLEAVWLKSTSHSLMPS